MTITVTNGRAVTGNGAALRGVRGRRAARQEQELAEYQAGNLAARWARVAYGSGLGTESSANAGGSSIISPEVIAVDLDSPRSLVVKMLPGQIIGDYRKASTRLAEGMGVPWVRITAHRGRHGYIRVALVDCEPLSAVVDHPGVLRSVHDAVLIGRSEDGDDLALSLVDSGHIAVQGRTRLGKSMWAYALLASLAAAKDVEVCGSDPSGLLLRPWARRPGARIALGLADVERHAVILDELVSDMDARLATLPDGEDTSAISEGSPLLLVVLEELAGLIRSAKRVGGKLHERIQLAVGRLLSEGHKVGVRVLSITQRQDAELYGGGSPRGQFGLCLSFGADADALKMLHADVPADLAAAHAVTLPGIALISGVGMPLARIRGPYITGEYREYCSIIG